MNNNEKFNVICLSNQLWDSPSWTNKHHVMSRLSSAGHKVVFVDPPINTGNVFLTQIKRKLWNLPRLLTRQKLVNSNLKVFTPLNPIPFYGTTSKWHVSKINKIARGFFNKKVKTVLWVYHVETAGLKNYLDSLNYDFLVYDCVDNYEAFPQYDTPSKKQFIRNQESYLTQKADVVFATAPGLVEKLSRIKSANVFFMPNTGDYEKFKNIKMLKDSLPGELLNISRPIIGFTGSLDEYKFDIDLLKKLAATYQNYNFVLIGQIALKDKDADLNTLGLSEFKNVHFLGVKPYSIIQNYFAGFDAYIIPYQLNDYTVGGCFPVKFHDALAGGLPVIVTNMPAYYPFKDVCYISDSHEDFIKNLKIALEEDSREKYLLRQKVAKENTWESKVEKMTHIIFSNLKQ